MDYILYFFLINLFIYCLVILWFIIGIIAKNKSNSSNSNKNFRQNVSIILCVRNGEKSLPYILDDLKSQIYENKIEFIIVDDFSKDKSKKIINEYIKLDTRFKYVHSNTGNKTLSFKKKAIDAGIKSSKYNHLLFTDVDCRLNNKWVASMMNHYDDKINYIIGCSIVRSYPKFITKFQKIDFLMLMISSSSSANSKFPLACTGQNQSYKKELYLSTGGFSKISHLLQGDDTIFMQLSKANKSFNCVFNDDVNSFVTSKPHENWKDLLLQRIRWAGDAKIMWKYSNLFFIIILSTFFTNLFFAIFPLFSNKPVINIFLLLLIKFIFEIILYYFGSKRLKQPFNFFNFISWFIIQIPYVIIVGILSFFISYFKWKDRIIAKA